MATKSAESKAQNVELGTDELLRKLLAVELYRCGAPKDAIGKAVGRRKAWVVSLLEGLPDRRRQ